MTRLLAAAFMLVVTAAPGRSAEPLRVQAVNGPLAHFAETIAGPAAEVVMPVPAGADPATWQPGIAELGALQQADLILLNGAGLYGWTERVSLPRAKLVDTARAFPEALIEVGGVTHSHGAEGEHSHAATATDTWLDFGLAAQQAEAVRAALTRLRPDAAADFAERFTALQAELGALNAEAARIGALLDGRPLVAQHSGYEYLARRYGMNIAAVAWDREEPPDAAALAELDALLKRHPARLMLWAEAPGPEAAAALAERGLAPVVFDTAASAADATTTLAAGLAALAAAASSLGR